MKPLYTESEFKNAKSTDKLPCQCYHCGKTFYEYKKIIANALRPYHHQQTKYCSHECADIANRKRVEVRCINCNTIFQKTPSRIKKSKSGNHFCSKACAATYNNKHKTKGNRRSKLEIYLQQKLNELFPDLQIKYNNKEIINSELDIYIPSLNLAFELNGVFHYEPIFGSDKLDQIRNNDQRKFQACLGKQIELCIIDTSQQKYFKEDSANKYLQIILNVLNSRLVNKSLCSEYQRTGSLT
jgi:hypothetical protein